jgi:RNA polymerase sigma-70 factor (ECF subfamily)
MTDATTILFDSAPAATARATEPPLNAEDAALIARVRSGYQRACEQLVRQYGPRMLAVARRFFRCDEDATDAVQDAFLSAFASLDRFAGKAALGTWLHRVVVNACLMRLRRRPRNEESIEPLLPRFKSDGHHASSPQHWDDEAFRAAERSELRDHIRACIDRLPESYRAVLLLRDIEEFDTEETARLLDCTPNNVKVRLHRARHALKTLLDPIVSELL